MKRLRRVAVVAGVLLAGALLTAQAVAPGGLAGIVSGNHIFSGNVAVQGYVNSPNGFGNGSGTGGASQGIAFSGSTTSIVCGDNNVCLINISDNSGHNFAQFTSAGVDLTGSGTGVAKTNGLTCSGSTYCGTKALTAGSGTVTVVSGCHPICTDTTAAAAVKCSVSSTTLTITGTSTDSINYFCF